MVVYYRRPGGRCSTLAASTGSRSDRIRSVLSFAREFVRYASVERLAEEAHLSVRQFSRAFMEATGTTPAKAIERLRAKLPFPGWKMAASR